MMIVAASGAVRPWQCRLANRQLAPRVFAISLPTLRHARRQAASGLVCLRLRSNVDHSARHRQDSPPPAGFHPIAAPSGLLRRYRGRIRARRRATPTRSMAIAAAKFLPSRKGAKTLLSIQTRAAASPGNPLGLVTPSPASRRKNHCGRRFSPSPRGRIPRATKSPPSTVLRCASARASAGSTPSLGRSFWASPRGTPDEPDALAPNRREP